LFVAGLILASTASAATYYVATNGSDSNSGTISQPFRTIGKGTSNLKSGDTLYIRGGTYNEIILGYDVPAGASGAPTTIAGYQNENPTIRCDSPCGTEGLSLTLFNRHITLKNFTIDNINRKQEHGACIVTDGDYTTIEGVTCLNASRNGIMTRSSNNVIRNSVIKNCGRINPAADTANNQTKGLGIMILAFDDVGSSNTLVENNLIEGCRAGGIDVGQGPPTVKNVTVRNNIISNAGSLSTWSLPHSGFPQEGNGLGVGNVANFVAYNNTMYNIRGTNGGTGRCIWPWGGGQGAQIYNNTCHNIDSAVQIGLPGDSKTGAHTIINNIWSNVTKEIVNYSTGPANNISNNLLNPDVASTFVNASAGDFRLVDSQGIGANGVTGTTSATSNPPAAPVALTVGQ
jgi:hypothetical protein